MKFPDLLKRAKRSMSEENLKAPNRKSATDSVDLASGSHGVQIPAELQAELARHCDNLIAGEHRASDAARRWPLTLSDRRVAVSATLSLAGADQVFRKKIGEADELRDAGEWEAAEKAYRAALVLHQLHRGYWMQVGHCAKEQNQFIDAEIAYRTAFALGEVTKDALHHLKFAAERNGGFTVATIDRVRDFWLGIETSPRHAAPPIESDITAAYRTLLGRTPPGQGEVLKLMDAAASVDAALGLIIQGAEFASANRDLLLLLNETGGLAFNGQ